MSTKRDRLKKMRDEHRTPVNEETPAEEYIEAAANYQDQTEWEKSKETPAVSQSSEEEQTGSASGTDAAPGSIDPVQPAPVYKEVTASTFLNPQHVEAPAYPQPIQSPAQTSVPASASASTSSSAPASTPAPAPTSAPAPAPTPGPAPTSAPAPVHSQVTAPSRTYQYSVANAPGKRISVSLRTENKNWMHRTALRCGLSIQDYMNILIEEAWAREQEMPYQWNDNDPLPERIPSSKTILVAIKLSNVNIERSQRMRAARCMTMTYYMNYLIEEEIRREQLQGMRRAVFD